MMDSSSIELFGPVLRGVSRSFSLTLRVLPSRVRHSVGLAYLLARAADTLADGAALPREERRPHLLLFRRALAGGKRERVAELRRGVLEKGCRPASDARTAVVEWRLLELLPVCFGLLGEMSPDDRLLVMDVVLELTRGMELDLARFGGGNGLAALRTFEELEDYTWLVAGCVGPFWTRLCARHLRACGRWDLDRMCALGGRFGKALQWTNVLRDVPRDLQNGRCYLPSDELASLGLEPADLLDPSAWPRLAPFYGRCLDHALRHYRAAAEYARAIPRRCVRLRLACLWPMWIGLETLALLRRAPNPLVPEPRLKISRARVRAILARTAASCWSDRLLTAREEKLFSLAKAPASA
ncbi:MAG: squalene/phytoene synthase family protein [Verrucomicrobiae bacterium]|nr:squalene/phytoene synthase family protein [Verrucomicrobiae bacterium]